MEEPTAVIGPAALQELRELQAHVKQLQDEYDVLNTRHTALWQLRKAGTASREQYVDFLMTSDRMEVLLHELAAMQPRLVYAEAASRLAQGKSHHDALVSALTEAVILVCQRWAAFIQACQGFVELADEQIHHLWSLPDASGQPAFDLPGGAELLQRLLGVGFPHAGSSSLIQMVVLTLQTPFTQGDQHRVVGMVPGTRPFPPGLVERYLAGSWLTKASDGGAGLGSRSYALDNVGTF